MKEKLFSLLKDISQPKWQSASTLAKKLDIKSIDKKIVEKFLIDYFKNTPNPKIRYSSLPSRKSLEVLWGHIDKVGNKRLVDIFKEDEELNPEYLKNILDVRNIFLSHSFKDTDKVLQFAEVLIENELHPWLAEIDINQGEHINNGVINAIRELPFFGIYLTENILKSKWSAKEFDFAIRNKKKLYAFIPNTEQKIFSLIKRKGNINSDFLRKIFDYSYLIYEMEFYTISLIGEKLVMNKISVS